MWLSEFKQCKCLSVSSMLMSDECQMTYFGGYQSNPRLLYLLFIHLKILCCSTHSDNLHNIALLKLNKTFDIGLFSDSRVSELRKPHAQHVELQPLNSCMYSIQ